MPATERKRRQQRRTEATGCEDRREASPQLRDLPLLLGKCAECEVVNVGECFGHGHIDRGEPSASPPPSQHILTD